MTKVVIRTPSPCTADFADAQGRNRFTISTRCSWVLTQHFKILHHKNEKRWLDRGEVTGTDEKKWERLWQCYLFPGDVTVHLLRKQICMRRSKNTKSFPRFATYSVIMSAKLLFAAHKPSDETGPFSLFGNYDIWSILA